MWKKILLLLALASAGGYGGWSWYGAGSSETAFRTIRVERGDLLATIDATGTIEPEEVIDIGAQVAGRIVGFGPDPRANGKPIDYGSPVEKDTVLARIDDSLFQAEVDRTRAQLSQTHAQLESAAAQVEQARADVARARADLANLRAKLHQADRDWKRAQKLYPTRALSDAEYDNAEAAFRTAKATLAIGEATLVQARAALKNAQANVAKAEAAQGTARAALHTAEINLGYCTIKSPVKGVIVDRRVNVGQTVVSSLNAPSLFLIAKDLKRLQVWASVNEADIGSIRSGQAVTFTVDAFPGRVFRGEVAPDQPRLNASMTQNVVTYTVVVNTDNTDGKLKPYLTANLRFEVNRRRNVLLVPNAALRWKPSPELVAPRVRDEYGRARADKGKSTSGEQSSGGARKTRCNRGTLWVAEGDFVVPVKVRPGLSDGLMTEVTDGGLKEGAVVVVGEGRAAAAGGVKNPFAPKLFGDKKQP
jgi:HlyD family secretion protein